jgi:hypothetical protein
MVIPEGVLKTNRSTYTICMSISTTTCKQADCTVGCDLPDTVVQIIGYIRIARFVYDDVPGFFKLGRTSPTILIAGKEATRQEDILGILFNLSSS